MYLQKKFTHVFFYELEKASRWVRRSGDNIFARARVSFALIESIKKDSKRNVDNDA